MVKREVRIVIAGGGTGGHLFPGVAVAGEMVRRCPASMILFITGGRKMESEIVRRSGFMQETIQVEGLKGKGWMKGLAAAAKLPYGLVQSFLILRRFSPHVVLGVGGYCSGPVCLGSSIMGIPTAIHEQNSYPGITNRLLCRVVDRVFLSFEESRPHFPGGTLHFTGNPVRQGILRESAMERREKKGFTVLVVGGSQGARAVNEAFLDALGILRSMGRNPEVIHQTGEAEHAKVVAAYREEGLQGEVVPFIEDMGEAYAEADLVVGRAGAGTVSELAALGKPSILIPYPYAANRHQDSNAQALARVGGAEMLSQHDLSAQRLAGLLMKYMDDKDALRRMGEAARTVGMPEAAMRIADNLMEMMRS